MARIESGTVVDGSANSSILVAWDVPTSCPQFPVLLWSSLMTLTRFVTKNAFRNKRRSILTVLSIAFSLLLLTLMMTIWRAFYLDQGSAESAERLVVRHRVSLTFNLPGYYREKIRAMPGVVSVVPVSWFGGIYKDQKPENFFAQFGTDPEEFFKSVPRCSTCRKSRSQHGSATARA